MENTTKGSGGERSNVDNTGEFRGEFRGKGGKFIYYGHFQ